MSKLADWFAKAGTLCGLAVEENFTVSLSDGRELSSIVRIASLGAENGMLIFTDYELVHGHTAELISLGYGFSTMSEPRFDEQFDLESFEEVFTDWGWAGRPK